MGIFDGILICSDWDGTLFTGDTVPAPAQKAINYFMSEGGLFAISSGRMADYIYGNRHLVHPNTYCICTGGSHVCNIDTGEVILDGGVGIDAYDVCDTIISLADVTRVNLFTKNDIIHLAKEEYLERRKSGDLPTHNYKITLNFSSDTEVDKIKPFAYKFSQNGYTLARSFLAYIEIMKSEYTKGESARLVKKKVGARVLVGMGDYENDLPLFEKCDISFAVSNAVDDLKKIATYVTKSSVHESAVAEIISTLEDMIKNNKL